MNSAKERNSEFTYLDFMEELVITKLKLKLVLVKTINQNAKFLKIKTKLNDIAAVPAPCTQYVSML